MSIFDQASGQSLAALGQRGLAAFENQSGLNGYGILDMQRDQALAYYQGRSLFENVKDDSSKKIKPSLRIELQRETDEWLKDV